MKLFELLKVLNSDSINVWFNDSNITSLLKLYPEDCFRLEVLKVTPLNNALEIIVTKTE